jgi:hypothetical protein
MKREGKKILIWRCTGVLKKMCWMFPQVNMLFKLIMVVILRKNVYFTDSKKAGLWLLW